MVAKVLIFSNSIRATSYRLELTFPRSSLWFEGDHGNRSKTVLVSRAVAKYFLKISECCFIFFVADFDQVYSH